MGRLLLFSSSHFSAIRRVPLLGDLVRRPSHRLAPPGKPLWAQIRAGAAEGLWLELQPTARDYYEGRAEPRRYLCVSSLSVSSTACGISPHVARARLTFDRINWNRF